MNEPEVDSTKLEDLLLINEENLPECWHEQPLLYVRIARHAARASAALAEAELTAREIDIEYTSRTKLLAAELSQQWRQGGLPSGTKLTEESLKQAILLDVGYQQLERERWTKTHEVEVTRIKRLERERILIGLQKACEMRERSLKWLSVRRWGGGLEQPPETRDGDTA